MVLKASKIGTLLEAMCNILKKTHIHSYSELIIYTVYKSLTRKNLHHLAFEVCVTFTCFLVSLILWNLRFRGS